MASPAERAVRRHIREKAIIDRMARGMRKPAAPSGPAPGDGPTRPATSGGLSVEEQVRKKWTPDKGGLPNFWRDPPAFLRAAPPRAGRAHGK